MRGASYGRAPQRGAQLSEMRSLVTTLPMARPAATTASVNADPTASSVTMMASADQFCVLLPFWGTGLLLLTSALLLVRMNDEHRREVGPSACVAAYW